MLSQLINNNKSVDLLEERNLIFSQIFFQVLCKIIKRIQESKFADAVDQINNKLGKFIIHGAQGIQKEPVRFNDSW